MDENLQKRLRDLGRAVFEAISESPDFNQALDHIRAEGYSLSMQLNCRKDGSEVEAGEPSAHLSEPLRTPDFRIDGQDLSFLRSIGIDPTRRIRTRR